MWATRQAVGGGGTKEGAKAKGMVGSVRWFDINVRSFVVYLPVRSKIRLAAGAGAETVCAVRAVGTLGTKQATGPAGVHGTRLFSVTHAQSDQSDTLRWDFPTSCNKTPYCLCVAFLGLGDSGQR